MRDHRGVPLFGWIAGLETAGSRVGVGLGYRMQGAFHSLALRSGLSVVGWLEGTIEAARRDTRPIEIGHRLRSDARELGDTVVIGQANE